jgi:hypothetical protein
LERRVQRYIGGEATYCLETSEDEQLEIRSFGMLLIVEVGFEKLVDDVQEGGFLLQVDAACGHLSDPGGHDFEMLVTDHDDRE